MKLGVVFVLLVVVTTAAALTKKNVAVVYSNSIASQSSDILSVLKADGHNVFVHQATNPQSESLYLRSIKNLGCRDAVIYVAENPSIGVDPTVVSVLTSYAQAGGFVLITGTNSIVNTQFYPLLGTTQTFPESPAATTNDVVSSSASVSVLTQGAGGNIAGQSPSCCGGGNALNSLLTDSGAISVLSCTACANPTGRSLWSLRAVGSGYVAFISAPNTNSYRIFNNNNVYKSALRNFVSNSGRNAGASPTCNIVPKKIFVVYDAGTNYEASPYSNIPAIVYTLRADGHTVLPMYNDHNIVLASYDLFKCADLVVYVSSDWDYNSFQTLDTLTSFARIGGNVVLTGYDMIAYSPSQFWTYLGGTDANDASSITPGQAGSVSTDPRAAFLTQGVADITGLPYSGLDDEDTLTLGAGSTAFSVISSTDCVDATPCALWTINPVGEGNVLFLSGDNSNHVDVYEDSPVHHAAIRNLAFNSETPTDDLECDFLAKNILIVAEGMNVPTPFVDVLAWDGHSISLRNNDDFSFLNNPANLNCKDLIIYVEEDDAHPSDTMFNNLNTFAAAGGTVVFTGYDAIASPYDPRLIAFLGGDDSYDVATTSFFRTAVTTASYADRLTTGIIDIRNYRTEEQSILDDDNLDHDFLIISGSSPAKPVVLALDYQDYDDTSLALWAIRPAGINNRGAIVWLSSSYDTRTDDYGTIANTPAYQGAIRNLAHNAFITGGSTTAVTFNGFNNNQFICGDLTFNAVVSSLAGCQEQIFFTTSNPAITIDSPVIKVPGTFPITITCTGTGPFVLTGTLASTGATVLTRNGFCKGELFLVNPVDSTIRGTDFNLTVGIYPPAAEQVEITVYVDNPLIIPGNERLTIPAGQTEAVMRFISPVGEVGPVNIEFASRKLFDYGPDDSNCKKGILVHHFSVLGTMVSSLDSVTVGDGLIHYGNLTLQPPAGADGVVVDVDYSQIGRGGPPSLHYTPGQSVRPFGILPDGVGNGNMVFSSQYYVTLNAPLNVIGTIFTDVNFDHINIAEPLVVTITLLPEASGPLTMTITTSSNLDAPVTLDFAAGESVKQITVSPLSLGSATITYQANGYVTEVDHFTINDVPLCPDGQILNGLGTACAVCPGSLLGFSCGVVGQCVVSLVNEAAARCICPSGFEGPYCQFILGYTDGGVASSVLDEIGGTFTYPGSVLPGTTSSTFFLPPGLIPVVDFPEGESGDAHFFLEAYNPSSRFEGAVDPVGTAPKIAGYTVTPFETGYAMTVSAADNSPVNFTASQPIVASFAFDEEELSLSDFYTAKLFYWNRRTHQWIPAENTCPVSKRRETRDSATLTLSDTVCAYGQFQIFLVAPVPASSIATPPPAQDGPISPDQLPPAPATTGVTGLAPPLPPQPNFNFGPDNGASSLSASWSLMAILAAVLSIWVARF